MVFVAVRVGIIMLCILFLGGCAARLPRTIAVSGIQQQLVNDRLADFLDKSCPTAVDCDLRLGWQAYGKREIYPATLQAAAPSYVRVSLVDPLSRPLLLLAGNGRRFTLADNRKGIGYTGRLDSKFIQKYQPRGFVIQDFFFWLSGRVRLDGLQIIYARKAKKGGLYWYTAEYGTPFKHMFGIDKQLHLTRHLILDARGTVLLDASYSGYFKTHPAEECSWPGTIHLDVDNQTASFTLEFTKIYSLETPKPGIFQLQLPKHFTVEQVQ